MPTIYREGPYRFFFNSRKETRMHVMYSQPMEPASSDWSLSSHSLIHICSLSGT